MTSTDSSLTSNGATSTGATGPEPGPGTLRPTRQRTAVTEALTRVDDFRSAQEIHEMLSDAGEKVGLATVYRTLAALSEAGVVDVLRTEDGESLYRRCVAEHHHHHLVCRTCGATVEIEGPAVEAWAAAVAREHGYADISHELELFGTCRACATG
ncbi:Fur family transcriptional regulator [Nocardioides jishulii]|uniref:Transcriptional repressor n=1 Tax=Nocardioides jishulii TaxID=2575440 RepID=A0A4U2YHT0_9ACTN|nr:Fur family transcriptional regulator [Nocardioides jishulii]QCX27963.1 transcriptional repressor [Nocardioides jishulii]TKI60626.1 transcriptional repressor [Nocardioides jishulii]